MTIEQLYKLKHKYVLRVCYKWLKNEQHAEELSQEFFTWIAKRLNRFDPTRSTFNKWFNANLVFRIGTYINYMKRNCRTERFEVYTDIRQLNTSCTNTLAQIEQAANRASIILAMKYLTKTERKVVMLSLDTDYTLSEQAKELNMTATGIRFHRSKAYPKIRKALANQQRVYKR